MGLRRKSKAAERTQDAKHENISSKSRQVTRHLAIPDHPTPHPTGKESGMDNEENKKAEAEWVSPWGPEVAVKQNM